VPRELSRIVRPSAPLLVPHHRRLIGGDELLLLDFFRNLATPGRIRARNIGGPGGKRLHELGGRAEPRHSSIQMSHGMRNGKITTAWTALAIIAAAPTAAHAQTTAPREPRSCQQMHKEMNRCEAGMRSCDQRVVDRLQARCQRDDKRLPQVRGSGASGRP